MTQHDVTTSDGVRLHAEVEGDGPTIVFANSLGTDLHLWDAVVPRLPGSLRVVRWDKRGHGRSDVPPAPYAMGRLIADAEAVCDALEVREALFVGLSIGGMIAQGLAVKRPDLIRAAVLSNTGVKIATPAIWQERIDAIRDGGLEAIADAVMTRWFSRGFDQVDAWRARFLRTPVDGYVGCSHAIAGTDLLTPTSGLRLPVLTIAGDEDGATPPDMLRELADLIPGSRSVLIRGAGHLPCVEKPDDYVAALTAFIDATGHRG